MLFRFSHLYNKRSLSLKGDVAAAARRKWPGVSVVERVVDAAGLDEGAEIAIVGTAFKEMAKRPDVLAEYQDLFAAADAADAAADAAESYASADDAIVLEDESGRVKIVGAGSPLPAATMATGLIVAVRGRVTGDGELAAADYCGCGYAAPRDAPAPMDDADESPLVLLLAGPCAADVRDETAAAGRFALLTEWLSGALGDAGVARRVARVVVAGDVVCMDPSEAAAKARTARALTPPNGSSKGGAKDAASEAALAPVRVADVMLARLAALAPTDAMPGPADPTSFTMPQQPLHPLLLPTANRYADTFVAAPNPHECEVGGKLLLGHSGQPVQDMLKHADYAASAAARGATRAFNDGASCVDRHVDGDDDAYLACLEDTLWWRVLAPTAPDTLPSYPFQDADPFVIDDAPDVLFAGSAPAFATSAAVRPDGSRAARVVALPSFATTGVCCLLDLATLDVERLEFAPPADAAPPATASA